MWSETPPGGKRGSRKRRLAAAGTGRRRGRRWLAVVCAALLSLAFQSFLVQTHVHLRHSATTRADGVRGEAAGLAHHRGPASAPLDCLRCRLLAGAGQHVLPGSAGLAMPLAIVGWFLLVQAASAGERRKSHAWQSRGPPR